MLEFLALCAVGAEPILSNELKLLDFKPVNRLPGRVFFTSTLKEPEVVSIMRANFYLRTADRLYLVLKEFAADNFDTLYDTVAAVDWQRFFSKDSKITVDKVRTFKSKLASEHAVQRAVHKAVCTALCSAWKMDVLPETGKEYAMETEAAAARRFLRVGYHPD